MADDVARDDQVADVLDDDDEGGRQNDEDGAEVELRRVEGRQGEPRCAFDERPVDGLVTVPFDKPLSLTSCIITKKSRQISKDQRLLIKFIRQQLLDDWTTPDS